MFQKSCVAYERLLSSCFGLCIKIVVTSNLFFLPALNRKVKNFEYDQRPRAPDGHKSREGHGDFDPNSCKVFVLFHGSLEFTKLHVVGLARVFA